VVSAGSKQGSVKKGAAVTIYCIKYCWANCSCSSICVALPSLNDASMTIWVWGTVSPIVVSRCCINVSAHCQCQWYINSSSFFCFPVLLFNVLEHRTLITRKNWGIWKLSRQIRAKCVFTSGMLPSVVSGHSNKHDFQ